MPSMVKTRRITSMPTRSMSAPRRTATVFLETAQHLADLVERHEKTADRERPETHCIGPSGREHPGAAVELDHGEVVPEQPPQHHEHAHMHEHLQPQPRTRREALDEEHDAKILAAL